MRVNCYHYNMSYTVGEENNIVVCSRRRANEFVSEVDCNNCTHFITAEQFDKKEKENEKL